MSPQFPPIIPERSSSKHALEIASDLLKKRSIEKEIQEARKSIKVKGSFDANYWVGYKEVTDLELKRHELHRKISCNQFIVEGRPQNKWEDEPKAKILQEEKSALEIKQRVLKEQIERLSYPSSDKDRRHREWIMQMLTLMPVSKGGLGLGDEIGQGRRESAEQSSFRARLELQCNSKHPDEDYDEQWCPILGQWVPEASIRAAHIFPYAAGKIAMQEMFGGDENDADELMEPENGLMVSLEAEKKIATGLILIVPDVPDNATVDQLDAWTKMEPKEYKLRVLNPNHEEMRKILPPYVPATQPGRKRRVWGELDGQSVHFRGRHRPRARYLYWQFAVGLLRQALQSNHRQSNPVAKEFGKKYWGNAGSYIKRCHLRGFAEHLGHTIEWDNSTDAYMKDEDQPSPGGLILGLEQIRASRKSSNPRWETEEEIEDDTDDEDDDEKFEDGEYGG